mmetsp:Transcript_20460/g.54768  ORF Transcript_20460/g.54768 Transcript_20460/m.54768 type:complete len:366 (-) Transcript_20460:1604-2701(-)
MQSRGGAVSAGSGRPSGPLARTITAASSSGAGATWAPLRPLRPRSQAWTARQTSRIGRTCGRYRRRSTAASASKRRTTGPRTPGTTAASMTSLAQTARTKRTTQTPSRSRTTARRAFRAGRPGGRTTRRIGVAPTTSADALKRTTATRGRPRRGTYRRRPTAARQKVWAATGPPRLQPRSHPRRGTRRRLRRRPPSWGGSGPGRGPPRRRRDPRPRATTTAATGPPSSGQSTRRIGVATMSSAAAWVRATRSSGSRPPSRISRTIAIPATPSGSSGGTTPKRTGAASTRTRAARRPRRLQASTSLSTATTSTRIGTGSGTERRSTGAAASKEELAHLCPQTRAASTGGRVARPSARLPQRRSTTA